MTIKISMLTFVLFWSLGAPAQTPALTTTPTQEEAPAAPAIDPDLQEKIENLCTLTESCNKNRPGIAAECLKKNLKKSGFLNHVLEGSEAKDLARFLRRDGFVDVEIVLQNFSLLRDGSILVLDAHDPVKDHRPACPKVYGNVLVKCGDKWVDDRKSNLDFHMERGCRTKGIWALPALKPERPKPTK